MEIKDRGNEGYKPLTAEEYESIHKAIKEAESSGDRAGYIMQITKLAGSLYEEAIGKYSSGPPSDLDHSIVEWARQLRGNFLVDQGNRDKVESGEGVKFKSNTLINQKVPHPSDETSTEVSKTIAGAVAGFVAGRGGEYLTASVVIGWATEQISPFQTETSIKGFGQSS